MPDGVALSVAVHSGRAGRARDVADAELGPVREQERLPSVGPLQGLERVPLWRQERVLLRALGQRPERRPIRTPKQVPERSSLQEPKQQPQRTPDLGPLRREEFPLRTGGWATQADEVRCQG